MTQILHLQIGSSGNRIGAAYWDQLNQQHSLDSTGRIITQTDQDSCMRVSTCFKETQDGRYLPRTLLLDTETTSIQRLMSTQFGQLVKSENIIYSHLGSRGVWQTAYAVGQDIRQNILDALQREMEECDTCSAVEFIHSLGGGAAGLACKVQEMIAQYYPKLLRLSFNTFNKNGGPVHQNYTSMFSLANLIENRVDAVHFFETSSILDRFERNIQRKRMKDVTVSYKEINKVIASSIADLNCCERLPCQKSASLRKIYTNLIPFPHLNLVVVNNSDLLDSYSPSQKVNYKLMHRPETCLSGVDVRTGRTISAATIVRGSSSSYDQHQLDLAAYSMQNISSSIYVSWLPMNVSNYSCLVNRRRDAPFTGTSLSLSTALRSYLEGLLERVQLQNRRKAGYYLQKYTDPIFTAEQFRMAREHVKQATDNLKFYEQDIEGGIQDAFASQQEWQ